MVAGHIVLAAGFAVNTAPRTANAGVGVNVGGKGVLVGSGVFVGSGAVGVGGRSVLVGGMVGVGGMNAAVGIGVAVGGMAVLVGGICVGTGALFWNDARGGVCVASPLTNPPVGVGVGKISSTTNA